jgi:hypothetical protein
MSGVLEDMVSILGITRLMSAQLALRTLKGGTSESADTGADDSRARYMQILTSGGTKVSSSTLSALLDHIGTGANTTTPAVLPAKSDVTKAEFMKDFKASLEAEAKKEGESGKAHEMLAALKAGTLTITDPVNGKTIKAWDPADNANKTGSPEKASSIKTSNWNDFISIHLKRDGGSHFVKRDGNYVDRKTDQSVAFTVTNGTKAYVSWTVPKEEPTPDPRPR